MVHIYVDGGNYFMTTELDEVHYAKSVTTDLSTQSLNIYNLRKVRFSDSTELPLNQITL
jgi:hypothetical protein